MSGRVRLAPPGGIIHRLFSLSQVKSMLWPIKHNRRVLIPGSCWKTYQFCPVNRCCVYKTSHHPLLFSLGVSLMRARSAPRDEPNRNLTDLMTRVIPESWFSYRDHISDFNAVGLIGSSDSLGVRLKVESWRNWQGPKNQTPQLPMQVQAKTPQGRYCKVLHRYARGAMNDDDCLHINITISIV